MTHIITTFSHTRNSNLKQRIEATTKNLYDPYLAKNIEYFRKAVEDNYLDMTENSSIYAVRCWNQISPGLFPIEKDHVQQTWGELNRNPSAKNLDEFHRVCDNIKRRAKTGNMN